MMDALIVSFNAHKIVKNVYLENAKSFIKMRFKSHPLVVIKIL